MWEDIQRAFGRSRIINSLEVLAWGKQKKILLNLVCQLLKWRDTEAWGKRINVLVLRYRYMFSQPNTESVGWSRTQGQERHQLCQVSCTQGTLGRESTIPWKCSTRESASIVVHLCHSEGGNCTCSFSYLLITWA